MISVDKYIRKLIYEQNCVIIPGFGGIMTHYVHSQYNEGLKQYSPSKKKIAFNEVLKQDDGLLVHTIVRYEKVDRNEAVETVKQYVKNLTARIVSEGQGEVDGVGSFSQNGEGSLVFEPLKEVSFETDWFGFTEIAARRITEAAPKIAQPSLDTFSTNYEEENAEDMMVLGTSKRSGWMRWTAAAVTVGAITYFSTIYGSVSSSTSLSSLNPLTALLESMEPRRDKFERSESSEKKAGEFDFADSLIREINGMAHPGAEEAALVGVTDTIVAINVPQELVEVVKEEANLDVLPVPVTVEVKKEIQPIESKKFHLVAGSFSTERTAAKLVKELKDKGFSDAITLEHKGKELVKVSARSYASMSEAYKGRADLEKVVGAGVWVFRDR
jgi:hypothetical protein